VTKFWNAIVAWFKAKSITSHTVAAAVISAATLISTDQQVRDFLISSCQAHPKIAAEIIALSGIILKYTRSSSPAGEVKNVIADSSAGKLTVPATIPPNPAIKDVPAELKPLNPNAVPVDPAKEQP
jgi:hypothetical protein